MKIICLRNTGDVIPEKYLNPALYLTKETEFKLIINKVYTVYALESQQGEIWYYICDERYTYFPIHNPAPLFKVIDLHPSRYWRMELAENDLLTLAF